MPEVSLGAWKAFLLEQPDTHLLQTAEWGELKSDFGWEARRFIAAGMGMQVMFRRLPFDLSVAYVPKASIGLLSARARDDLFRELDALCKHRRAILCKVEPDGWLPDYGSEQVVTQEVWPGNAREAVAAQNIQPRRTITVDLGGSEAEILGRMKPKCRYNIHLAEKKGVTVQAWEDLSAFHEMMRTTGSRDGFGVHSAAYYRRAFELFHASGNCELLVARYGSRPLAALMVFARGRRAWYMYGASTEEERSRMPNYLLQWEAMRWAKHRNCEDYDLWGVPDEDEAVLEAQFEKRSDGLWGVYRFKRGFGGKLRRAGEAIDRVYRPLMYQLYRWRAPAREIS